MAIFIWLGRFLTNASVSNVNVLVVISEIVQSYRASFRFANQIASFVNTVLVLYFNFEESQIIDGKLELPQSKSAKVAKF